MVDINTPVTPTFRNAADTLTTPAEPRSPALSTERPLTQNFGEKNGSRRRLSALDPQNQNLIGWIFLLAFVFKGDEEKLNEIADILDIDQNDFREAITGSNNPIEATNAASRFSYSDRTDFSRLRDFRSNNTFDYAVDVVLESEGVFSNHAADGGGATIYGIASKYNRSEFNQIMALRERGDNEGAIELAKQVYKEKYWDTIDGIDNLSAAAQIIAFDTAVNSGVGTAEKMLRNTGDDPEAMLAWRENNYDRIIANNPSQSVFARGWDNRLTKLAAAVDDIPNQLANNTGNEATTNTLLADAFKPQNV